MESEVLKKHLLNWLHSEITLEDEQLKEAILKYEGNDEVINGAKKFLINHQNNLSALKNTITELKTPNSLTATQNKKTIQKSYLMAASVALIIFSACLFFYFSSYKKTSYIIYEEGLPVFMGINDTSSFDDFMNSYRLGNYNEAEIKAINQNHLKSSDTLNYFLGCCYNYTNNYEMALTCFKKVKQPFKFNVSLKYQMAYSQYMLGNKVEAKATLITIKDFAENIHAEKIEKMLQELNMNN